MRTFLLLCLLLAASANAQIYADFTVSSGGSPLGTFTVTLEHEKAPRTCANFIGLASGKRPWIDVTNGAVRTNRPYYNGLIFHRLIHSFVIQGGSPNGQGTDGPGYSILDEYDPTLRHSAQYVLSMAKSSFPNTGGSQFFITLRPTPELDDKHSVFGRVTAGMAIIDGFKNAVDFKTNTSDKPETPIVMDSVVIHGPDAETFDIDNPALRLPTVGGTTTFVSRNTENNTVTTAFVPVPRAEYMLFESFDLQTWSAPDYRLTQGSASPLSIVSDEISAPRFFTNLATINYNATPEPPQNSSIQGKKLKLNLDAGSYLEFSFTGPQTGTWYNSDIPRGGELGSLTWEGNIRTTGVSENLVSDSKYLSLIRFRATLNDYFAPGSPGQVGAWLSFHGESAGWVEEFSRNNSFRVPFEILSN